MDSKYGNIWSEEAGEWFCPNGHELGMADVICAECVEDDRRYGYRQAEMEMEGADIWNAADGECQ